MLTERAKPSRNRIERADIKLWAKRFNATPEKVAAAIEKVGDSVSAVEKELRAASLKT